MDQDANTIERGEFWRYRKVLTLVYVGVLAVGALFLTASVVDDLFFARGDSRPAPSQIDMVACERGVRGLLEDLVHTAGSLPAQVLAEKNIDSEWGQFEGKWRQRWEAINHQCQFAQLEETGLGSAYDRVASVHRDLGAMILKYRELMHHFTDGQAGELVEMRKALDKSRTFLETRQPPSEVRP